SLVQMDVKPLAPAENFARMRAFVAAEAEAGSNLILFPELSNTGYVEPPAPGSPFVSNVPNYAAALVDASADPAGAGIGSLAGLAEEKGVYIVAGLALRDAVLAGVIRNSSLLIGPGGVLGRYDKVHQWQNEKLYFRPGERIDVFDMAA